MAGNITVELKGIRLFATHGMFSEEAITGNEFEVNISLTYKAGKKIITEIEETINYVEVFSIVQEVILKERHQLLESCAMHIANRLSEKYEQLKEVYVNVQKVHAPIANFSGTVSVSFRKRSK